VVLSCALTNAHVCFDVLTDVCIIFDSDWNPQNDVQAQARCHRIGQTKDVRIYRLVTSRSFEQEMFDRASRKLGLEQAILGTFETGNEDDKPTNQEMEQLLRKGAYALLEDDNDDVTKAFVGDDIDSILAKRTRTRVVEGAKTASWLNKSGVVVNKSKFSAETGEQLDMDDPLFWQKVMPDFVTPSIMMQKLNDLQDEISGIVRKRRGRRRKVDEVKQNIEVKDIPGDQTKASIAGGESLNEEKAVKSDDNVGVVVQLDTDEDARQLLTAEILDELSEDEEDEENDGTTVELSRTNVRKVQKYISDLKSMMESILDDAEEEEIASNEKDTCQKLLLTISLKETIFNDEQRRLARKFLKRLEGDRKRRCRTSEATRFTPGIEVDDVDQSAFVPDHLRIGGETKKRRRRRVRNEFGELVERENASENAEKSKKRNVRSSGGGGAYVGEDGYLHHSDSEDDWSDVGEDLLSGTKKERITKKEAHRRRQWAADDDEATAAGRPWPVFPRDKVKDVLSTLLSKVAKHDEEIGGVFSTPVSREEFPEYYEHIKTPIDYSTMRTKLESGGYRSAQAMQKDFILILSNCRQFNAHNSQIVKEAREQHLRRPSFLREAAEAHNLFLAEDGSVLEIFDDEAKAPKSKKGNVKAGEDTKKVSYYIQPSSIHSLPFLTLFFYVLR
jgi:hypothetical protein